MRTRRERYQSPLRPVVPPRRISNVRRNSENSEDTMKKLREIYSNVKSIPSYSSKIQNFLRKNVTSSLFRQVRHNYPRRRIISYYPGHTMFSDTINYRNIGTKNKNSKYIMVFIDNFSKKAYAAAMKSMHEFDSVIGMESMLHRLPSMPQNIITDKGTEYYNSKMKSLFDRYAINHYSIRGKHKACVAERFIRTLKSRLEKYFWEKNTKNWVDVLDQFIENYNGTYHRSIKMAPNDVNDDNRATVFKTLFPKTKDITKARLNQGDQVRVVKQKNIFDKGYTRSWSQEIYTIVKTFSESGVDFYNISDSAGNILPRKKYYWELNLVAKNVD